MVPLRCSTVCRRNHEKIIDDCGFKSHRFMRELLLNGKAINRHLSRVQNKKRRENIRPKLSQIFRSWTGRLKAARNGGIKNTEFDQKEREGRQQESCLVQPERKGQNILERSDRGEPETTAFILPK